MFKMYIINSCNALLTSMSQFVDWQTFCIVANGTAAQVISISGLAMYVVL
jgi:hypothetical protein